jgi:hypothetical protein
VLSFVDPEDVDLAYAAEVAAVADRLAVERLNGTVVLGLLTNREVQPLAQTLRVLGSALLARFSTTPDATGIDVARTAGRIVTTLFDAGHLLDELTVIGELIAADMTPADPHMRREAAKMPAELLVTGLVLWVLALAVTVSYMTDEALPGGEPIRWVIGSAEDPDPLARIVMTLP